MKTKVTNTSGGALYCGWLPPHGRTLAEDQTVILPGDLRTILGAGGPSGRYSRKPQIQGMSLAEANGDVEIVSIVGDEESSENGN